MKNLLLGAAVAACGLAAASPAVAQYREDYRYYGDRHGGWETIGRKSINAGVDYDRIQVRGNERFKRIRVCSINRPFELRDMSANYANGRGQRFNVGMIVRNGQCTRAFDLMGRRRNITNIYLAYSRVGWGGQRPQLVVQAR